MESEKLQLDEEKLSSPAKISNGLDCNGTTDLSPKSQLSAQSPTSGDMPEKTNGLDHIDKPINGFGDNSPVAVVGDKQENGASPVHTHEKTADVKVDLHKDVEMEVKVDSHKDVEMEVDERSDKEDERNASLERDVNMECVDKSNSGDGGEGKDDGDEGKDDDGGNKTSSNIEKDADVNVFKSEGTNKTKSECVSVSQDSDHSITANEGSKDSVEEAEPVADKEQDKNSSEINSKESLNDKQQSVSPKGNQGKISKLERETNGDADDIVIVGESPAKPKNVPNILQRSKPISISSPFQVNISQSNGTSNRLVGTSLLSGAMVQNTLLLQQSNISSPSMNMIGGASHLLSGARMYPGQYSVASSAAVANAPPVPKSSMDQIELIRWEIQNRINSRPKYFKPNPSSELGSLAKFLFDIGSDLIKESVYHDLVQIQSKKNDDDKLSDKEKDDLSKLKEIEKDLLANIGHLKIRFKRRCSDCKFQTESKNVMFFHKQFPHEDNKILKCAHCIFDAKTPMAFKFHMEAVHNIPGRLHEKKAFYQCTMCPYENNQEPKLVAHRERCLKQFRPLFNLHPSCLSGAEINLCLENIFYKPVISKNLKLLQQKHAQQQAAIAEAKKQQAQLQLIAAQKNAAAQALKKQQQLLAQQQQQILKQRQLAAARLAASQQQAANKPRQPVLSRVVPASVPQPRFNNSKAVRPTVANMLNNRPASKPPAVKAQHAPLPSEPGSGFEVCEICGGYVKDRKALRIHFFYAHRIDLPFNLFERTQAPLYCATCYVRFWTAQGLRKHIETHKEENQTRGVVGKCISCGHHVLNLLLHMRIVHNRELQHYINALMCMFCGGHFGSRQDCERHIIKTHGNIDPTSGTVKNPPQSQSGSPSTPQQTSSGKSNKKGKSNSLVKGSVCVLCNLNFGRNVDLTRHCMRMHHTCMKCGMVVIDKASLLKHTCLTSPSGTRDCCICDEAGFHPAYYVKHLRDKHLRKFTIDVAKASKSMIESWTKRPCPFKVIDKSQALVEISDSDDDLEITNFVPPKRPKIGPASFKAKSAAVTKVKSKKAKIGPASKIGRQPVVIAIDDLDASGDDESQTVDTESNCDVKERSPAKSESKTTVSEGDDQDASDDDESQTADTESNCEVKERSAAKSESKTTVSEGDDQDASDDDESQTADTESNCEVKEHSPAKSESKTTVSEGDDQDASGDDESQTADTESNCEVKERSPAKSESKTTVSEGDDQDASGDDESQTADTESNCEVKERSPAKSESKTTVSEGEECESPRGGKRSANEASESDIPEKKQKTEEEEAP